MTDVLKLLKRSRELVSSGWCQFSSARDAKGVPCGAQDVNACSWCVTGAFIKAICEEKKGAFLVIPYMKCCEAIIGDTCEEPVIEWNDDDDTTQEAVVRHFDRIIEKLESGNPLEQRTVVY